MNNDEVVNGNDSRTNEMVVNLSKNNKYKNFTYMPNIEAREEPIFLILNAKKLLAF